MIQSYDLAAAYVATIAGSIDAPVDFRVLHDRDKGTPGQLRRGTLAQHWQWLCGMNDQGFGVFMVNARLDGVGQKMENVVALRSNYIDIDGADSQQQYERAIAAHPAPTFAVQSSPSKYHVFWKTAEHADRHRFTMVQKRLAALFHADPKVADATRVLRLAGTMHHKTNVPHLVTCWALNGFSAPTTIDALEAALSDVVVPETGNGDRQPLGEGDQAPSFEWLQHALTLTDPNELDRDQWLGISAAVKQAGWSLTDPGTLQTMWMAWCARYASDDPAENAKVWKSIDNTELGWRTLLKRVPSLQASVSFGQQEVVVVADVPPMPVAAPPILDCSGEYLTHLECEKYFEGCTFVTKMGQILAGDGRFMNASQFNGAFGGKQFIITGDGKKTDEPWKAATRSTLWTVPKVDHIRFLPHLPHGAIVKDDLGRRGVNMYKPAEVTLVEGDATPFLKHLALLLPDENDQRLLIEWMAHNVRFPGFKIPWAPVIQSTEGAGKGVFKRIMTHALGKPYVHFPNAKELTNSGSQFNGWLRNKLFILADEIRVDDKRDLIEVLKPMISEEYIEIQSKGVDQELEDCFANWMFFTNYKDAIPLNKNGRRYAVFYSALQTKADKPADPYYKQLYQWVKADGAAIVTDWLLRYPIERGAIPMEAPDTSSTVEAIAIGRSPIERTIQEAVEDAVPGFRGGWVSSIAAVARCKAVGAVRGNIAPQTISSVLEGMGYVEIGRADRPWFQEDRDTRTTLYARVAGADVALYGVAQGYE